MKILKTIASLLFGKPRRAKYRPYSPRKQAVPRFQKTLDVNAKSQRELEHFLSQPWDNKTKGRNYERQIGYLFEREDYDVQYTGILKGVKDQGRDLIAINDKEICIIQTKCWSSQSLISGKSIYYLHATRDHYKLTHSTNKPVRAVFFSSTEYSPSAKAAAKSLNVELHFLLPDKSYPMIKCNVGAHGSRIYHLPTDESYDKIKIKRHHGDCYVATAAEAANNGFRRAYRYKGPKSA